jgi:hypothetical protein
MADTDRSTVAVAIAGIAATALVGLAGTTAAWLSARNDRAAQRELARDERTYDRRVAVYLDAVDFVEGQVRSFTRWQSIDMFCPGPDPRCEPHRIKIPYESEPPPRLISRLRTFGSTQVFKAFQKTQSRNFDLLSVPVVILGNPGREYIVGPPFPWVKTPEGDFEPEPRFERAYEQFRAEVVRFENIVNDEVG